MRSTNAYPATSHFRRHQTPLASSDAPSSNSKSSRSSTGGVRLPELNRPRFTIPIPHPQSSVIANNTTDDEDEAGEDADVSMQAGSSPISVTESGGANHADAVIDSGGVRILNDDESYRDEAGTPESEFEKVETDEDGEEYVESSDENDDDGKTSKERKGSGDLDVADARKGRRSNKEEDSEQTDDDDDASDVELTSWNKRLRTRNVGKHHGSNTKATQQNSTSGTMRKGVAIVKKPVAKGRGGKGKQTWT